MKKFIIVETTYPNLTKAKKIGKELLSKNLAACIEFFPIISMYSWQQKIKNEPEILVRIKSQNSLFKDIKKIILKGHPYSTPQIISTQINQGSKTYLDWISSSTSNRK